MFILKGIPLLIARISNNRLVPRDFEHREIWHKPAGGFAPLWMRKLARGDKKFWLLEDDVPPTLSTPSRDGTKTQGGSSQGMITDLPPSLHSLPPAGTHHQAPEAPEKYDV